MERLHLGASFSEYRLQSAQVHKLVSSLLANVREEVADPAEDLVGCGLRLGCVQLVGFVPKFLIDDALFNRLNKLVDDRQKSIEPLVAPEPVEVSYFHLEAVPVSERAHKPHSRYPAVLLVSELILLTGISVDSPQPKYHSIEISFLLALTLEVLLGLFHGHLKLGASGVPVVEDIIELINGVEPFSDLHVDSKVLALVFVVPDLVDGLDDVCLEEVLELLAVHVRETDEIWDFH